MKSDFLGFRYVYLYITQINPEGGDDDAGEHT